MTRTVCVIPARYASTRFPGKVLARIDGIPLVMWPYRRAIASGAFDEVIVAADDERIVDEVVQFGGEAVMTDAGHRCGTERVAEAVSGRQDEFVVNIQADEPDIPLELLQNFVVTLKNEIDEHALLTCVTPATPDDKNDCDVVKAVLNAVDEALYFSRSPIPFCREKVSNTAWKHIGIYGFSRAGLFRYNALPQGRLEVSESLEQLRALEHGMRVRCLVSEYHGFGIDTPRDLEQFMQWCATGEQHN